MDEAAVAQKQRVLVDITAKNDQITQKIKLLEQLDNEAFTYGLHSFNRQDKASNPAFDIVKQRSDQLSKEIDDLIKEISIYDKENFQQFGDDITFDFDDFIENGDSTLKAGAIQGEKARRYIRRQLNFLTRRMSYEVRANQDKNLLIVDDFYDKDYDIAGFIRDLQKNGGGHIQSSDNDFMSVKEKVDSAAKVLNLEVFCDSQGHIRVRPPQYNRMPSSVFYKMMQQKKSLGIQIFPKFLESLFENQIKTLIEAIELTEDEIRLDCAFLGKITDEDCFDFIQGNIPSSSLKFFFISLEDGRIKDINDLLNQANPESKGSDFEAIESQATGVKKVFTSSQKFSFIKESILNNTISATLTKDAEDRINTLLNRIKQKSGGQAPNIEGDFVKTRKNELGEPQTKNIDIFYIANQLSQKISKRQKQVKLFYNAIKNAKEYRSLDDDESTSNKLLIFGTYGNNEIPSAYEHMIEDESYDDYGPGSGKRYIIKNSQIKNLTMQENAPRYTSVTVKGVLNTDLGGYSDDFAGNSMTVATAIDYDMWRTYGLTQPNNIEAPFLSSATSQCAPLAVSILSAARKMIISGNVRISGNEYMQVGDVVYLEQRGLLFYVTDVSHSYSEGRSFETTLTLEYGHAPGEYIPTTLDVVGKAIYNNRDVASFEIHRQSNSFNDIPYGALILDPKSKATLDPNKTINDYAESNIKTINNIIYASLYRVNENNSKGNNFESKVEFRIYYDKDNAASSELEAFVNEMITLLTTASDKVKVPLPADAVSIIKVDISSTTEYKSPSHNAFDAARNLAKIETSKLKDADNDAMKKTAEEGALGTENIKEARKKLTSALFNFVLDCFVTNQVKPPQKEGTQS